MILKLHDSKLFTVDTADRFAAHYKVSPKVWNELWKRHNNGYDEESLAGVFIFRTKQPITTKAIRRWLAKTEVYCRANVAMSMGARVVQSSFFGVYEEFVIKEVLRNMRYCGTKESRTLL